MAYVKLLNQDGATEHDLNFLKSKDGPKEIKIGRLAGNDIVTASMASGRNHALISFDGRNFSITDLNSTNGTYFTRRKGLPVRPDPLTVSRPYVLQHGDELQLGKPDQNRHVDRLRFYDGPIEIGPDSSSSMMTNPQAEFVVSVMERTDTANLREVIDGILEISRTLVTKLDIEEMGKGLMDQMPRVFPKGQRFLLFSTVPDTKYLRLLARKNHGRRRILSNDDDDDPTYSKTIYNQVVEGRNAVIYSDSGSQSHLVLVESIIDMGIRSIICAPVMSPDSRVLGMIQVDADLRDGFSRNDLDTLKVIGQQVGAAMHLAELHQLAISQAKREADMKTAAVIAASFLPRGVPAISGFEFYADYEPCEEVGGDFYHFTRIDDHHLAIGVCDVVGHGVPAALIMANLSSELRNSILTHQDPAQTLEHLDAVFTPRLNPPDSPDLKFFTALLAILDLRDGTLAFANGGHPHLIIRRVDGSIDIPDREIGGRTIGIDYGEDFIVGNAFENRTIRLLPGDVAIIYSDGLLDGLDSQGNTFGTVEKLKIFGEVIASTSGGPVAMGEAVKRRFMQFTAGGKIPDDLTLVCFGPKPDFQPANG